MSLRVFEDDPALLSVQSQIWDRVHGYRKWKSDLDKFEGGLAKFSEGYKVFGFNRNENGFVFREWLPKAKQVFLIGDFNGWQTNLPLKAEEFGRWCVELPNKPSGEPMIAHMSRLKLRLQTEDGSWVDRVPAWSSFSVQDHTTNLFNGVFWDPPAAQQYEFKFSRPSRPAALKIYEAHVGMSSTDPKVASYLDFARHVLPRIKRMGYNAVQLMAVAEHAHYGCFGYHVTSFFAPSSRSGTPEEVKEMVDIAHSLGIQVLVDLVHAHCSSNAMDGIAQMDGTDHCYTHGGVKGRHSEWDSSLFDYSKHEVVRFLLSNVRWWLEEYKFDGFRFDGVTSMLFQSHGIGKGFTGNYLEYFGSDADIDSHIYLMLANDLIHSLVPSAVTVGEDVSGMPTLCRPVAEGGFGFDYRLAMAIPDMFIKLLKEGSDESWSMGHIVHTLTNRRWKEKVIAYAESHDQAIVGDKTLAFWLMDAEMYTGMSLVQNPRHSLPVDRGLALHKMIRLLVLGLGGEGYLNFMGNEFGHPEWIDFPTEQNGWSYQHCRRRWDLADDDNLRYKFFEKFDELMQTCENRFGFLSADHEFVTVKSESDKVIAFERGDLLFVCNFHPTQSFTEYCIGSKWNEPMRTVLDTDEVRFGGHRRLEYGHSHSFPPLNAMHDRPHSIKLYLPARTAQVLVPERLLQGGISLYLEPEFLSKHGLESARGVKLMLQQNEEKEEIRLVDEKGCVTLERSSATFKLLGSSGEHLDCSTSQDGLFRIYFPGKYSIAASGYVYAGGAAEKSIPPSDLQALEQVVATVASPGKARPSVAIGTPVELALHAQAEESTVGSCPAAPQVTELHTQNVPEYIADADTNGMTRLSSLSAFDHILPAEDAVKLRQGREANEDVLRYDARHLNTPIVIVTSEVAPWSKTGGLGMVGGSYAYEFALRGHRTMCISPRYDDYEGLECVGSSRIWLAGQEHEVRYFHRFDSYADGKGCDYVFVEHDCYHRPAGLYCDTSTGKEYEDNLFRFALLSVAATEAPLVLNLGGFNYGQDVMFIANDWQAGLVPVYLMYKYRRHGTYLNARSMFVIHNLGFQGKYSKSKFPVTSHLGLPPDAIEDVQDEGVKKSLDCLNLLSAAVKTCDRVLTVSPNYCEEIQTPAGGHGLHELMSGKASGLRMAGILNGISDEWNPMTDVHIPMLYSIENFKEGKAKCKKALQAELGLHEDPDACLLGFCGRLSDQKGLHLIMPSLGWLMTDQGNGVNGRVQVILMGKGEEKYATQVREAESMNGGRICGYVDFDPKVEHRMMAGCDIILMPSEYEPCGLPQMYAQQYGALPFVHETGGLKDSVHGLWEPERDRGIATGFLFSPLTEAAFRERLYHAMQIFHSDKQLFHQMQTNAMKSNFYWPTALDEYEKNIDWTMERELAR